MASSVTDMIMDLVDTANGSHVQKNNDLAEQGRNGEEMLKKILNKLASLMFGENEELPDIKYNKKVYDLIVNLPPWDLATYLHAMQSSEKTELEIMDNLETCVEEIICNEDVCDTCPCNFENGCLLYGMPTR